MNNIDYLPLTEEEKIKYEVKPTEFTGCVWITEGGCVGPINEINLFEGLATIPACERHARDHINVVTLHKHGYDLNELFAKGYDYRRQEVKLLNEKQKEEIK